MTKSQKELIAPPSAPPKGIIVPFAPLLLHPNRNFMGCSFKMICKKNKLNKDGFAPIALQYFISRKKGELGLGIFISPELWNEKKQQIDVKGKNQDHIKYNLLIEKYRGDFNSVLIDLALQDITPTKELLKSRLENKNSREDFLQYFLNKYQTRYERNQIEYDTWKSHRTVVRKMELYKKQWPFSSMSNTFIKNFDSWHITYLKATAKKNNKVQKNNGYNTAQKTLAILRSYLILAKNDDKIIFEMPTISVSYVETSRNCLTQEELKNLIDKYFSGFYHYKKRLIGSLELFLWSCATGMRLSDMKQVNTNHVQDDCLNFIPYKGRKRQKEINIPIIGFISKILEGKQGFIFDKFVEQTVNADLKEIANAAKIDKSLSLHVGRHTFATLFLQEGGDLKSLQELMGHSNIKTTANYLHKDLSHIKKQMISGMTNLFTPTPKKK
ncbi:MAG: site-specific integrase [bacterium]|nr:site-specific integrase [bacterium]